MRWTAPLALALLGGVAACTPVLTGVGSGRAALFVLHGDGSAASACVVFEGDSITGEELLEQSGFSTAVDATNPMGLMVCEIDGEGCGFPSEACLCACRGAGGCSYWAYFNRDPGGDWVYAFQGATQRVVHDGDLDAWVWLDRAVPGDELSLPSSETDFESICG